MKHDNKGFSLLELIVIVAIIGVMTGLVAMSVMPKIRAEDQACAIKINSMIGRARLYSMSRENNNSNSTIDANNPARVVFELVNRKVYSHFYDGISDVPDTELMGSYRGSATDKWEYTIAFIRATGAPIVAVTDFLTDTDDNYYITVNGYTVTIDAVTGFHEVAK
ncbi:hypothetical protein FACS1894208_03440 [Clostridia bacterium]|nr:hypothetical protein FACS1894208_03440 [Clostridia bacterium]